MGITVGGLSTSWTTQVYGNTGRTTLSWDMTRASILWRQIHYSVPPIYVMSEIESVGLKIIKSTVDFNENKHLKLFAAK